MAPISPCQSGRRVIAGDRAARLSSFLVCVRVYVILCAIPCLSEWPQWQMWIFLHLHLHNRPQVYCRSSSPSPLIIVWPPAIHLGVRGAMMSFLSQGCLQGPWDTVTVSRNPIQASGRIEPLTCRQSRSQAFCYMRVCASAFVCLFVIMSYMKHEWQRWPMSQGRPSHSSTFRNPSQTHCSHVHSQHTGV